MGTPVAAVMRSMFNVCYKMPQPSGSAVAAFTIFTAPSLPFWRKYSTDAFNSFYRLYKLRP